MAGDRCGIPPIRLLHWRVPSSCLVPDASGRRLLRLRAIFHQPPRTPTQSRARNSATTSPWPDAHVTPEPLETAAVFPPTTRGLRNNQSEEIHRVHGATPP